MTARLDKTCVFVLISCSNDINTFLANVPILYYPARNGLNSNMIRFAIWDIFVSIPGEFPRQSKNCDVKELCQQIFNLLRRDAGGFVFFNSYFFVLWLLPVLLFLLRFFVFSLPFLF